MLHVIRFSFFFSSSFFFFLLLLRSTFVGLSTCNVVCDKVLRREKKKKGTIRTDKRFAWVLGCWPRGDFQSDRLEGFFCWRRATDKTRTEHNVTTPVPTRRGKFRPLSRFRERTSVMHRLETGRSYGWQPCRRAGSRHLEEALTEEHPCIYAASCPSIVACAFESHDAHVACYSK